MLLTITAASAGLALLYFGGEWLVRGASDLAARLGIPALAIGLTVVAFGTSAPELVVSLQAALAGSDDISIGNVVGSNIANVALILGLAALLCPVSAEAKIVRVDLPLLIGVCFALIALLWDGRITRLEGTFLTLGLFAYTGFTFWEAGRESDRVQEEFASAAPQRPARRSSDLLLVAGGLAALVTGGHLLVRAAVEIASRSGLSEAAIGLTVVAVGTSLPELATSIVAARRGQGDIAIGGVVGSNLFNILGILGVTAMVSPLSRGAIEWADLAVMTALAVALAVVLYTRRRLDRLEGGLLLAVYFGFTAIRLLG